MTDPRTDWKTLGHPPVPESEWIEWEEEAQRYKVNGFMILTPQEMDEAGATKEFLAKTNQRTAIFMIGLLTLISEDTPFNSKECNAAKRALHAWKDFARGERKP